MGTLRIYPRHARACRYCLVPGVKTWMEAHGISWQAFIREGVPASEILAVGDTMGNNVVEAALKEQQNGG